MSNPLSPIVSEFETEEHAASYDRWFRAKVLEAINNTKPRLPHDEAMAKVQAVLEARRMARATPSKD
ncbi:MAG TPA: stability determinant [Pseudomonas sp.]|nr:stability determinant [Pseudomonas sp.]